MIWRELTNYRIDKIKFNTYFNNFSIRVIKLLWKVFKFLWHDKTYKLR